MNAIIIQYDKRPNATIDEKLQSLIESIQLALNGMGEQEYVHQTSQDKDMSAVLAAIRQAEEVLSTLSSAVGGLGGRVSSVEGSISTLVNTTIPGIQSDISDLDEALETIDDTVGGHTTDISNLQSDYTALGTRVTALEGRWTAPAAPTTDGAYKLTVTVTDGVPVYTWELA